MDINNILMSKNGLVTLQLAREFIKLPVGHKIPTVSDFEIIVKSARGTVQNSMKLLQEYEGIKLESRGHLGTFLVEKDMKKLLEFAHITSIVGVMPLPYSKRYEGLASGLLVAMENKYNISTSMAYMRGANNRISMLLANRYDYAVVSKYAAEDYIQKNENIIIIKSFGSHSYLSEHVVIYKEGYKKINDGMRIGVDFDSLDQKKLTDAVCSGKKIEYVSVGYSQLLAKVINGEIDAAVWNLDEINEKIIKIHYEKIILDDTTDTEAVLVVNKDRVELVALLKAIIDEQIVLDTQKLVIEEKITPSY